MPGGLVCSVASCTNNSKRAKQEGQFLRFFTFPKDPKVREQWIRKCRGNINGNLEWDPVNKRICSKHFTPEDYEDKIKAAVLNQEPKKLIKDAIPSQFLIKEVFINNSLQNTSEEILQRLSESSECDPDTSAEKNTHITKKITNNSMYKSSNCCKLLLKKLNALQNVYYTQKKKIVELQLNEKLYKKRIHNLKIKLEKNNKEFESHMKWALRDILTPNQIDIVLKKKCAAHWTSKELSRAYTLKYLNKKTYIYLKETLRYPLPGISTLNRWATRMKSEGILDHNPITKTEMNMSSDESSSNDTSDSENEEI